MVLLGPISVGCLAAIVANSWIPVASTLVVALLRTLAIVVISTVVVWGVDRFARKLLPLAALMQLSLVFPDHAPSRFKSALKSGSSRRLERTLDETRRHGLAKDPGDAARQVVQLIGAIGDHDRRTRGHSERVRLFADLVGEELKLSKEDRQKLQWGALLHDLGKLMVPSEILNKKGKPDAEEWAILQGHPAAGMTMIEPLREFLGEWVHAIGGHHEKWDGSGYPQGLRGTQIPRSAAIVAVADSFEVMTAVRSYKKAMPLPEARAELTRCAGTHFSPEVVRAFLNISLGRLRIVAGPLAALAHLPFLGNLAQIPGAAAAAAPTMVGSVAVPAAAAMTAAALAIGTPIPRADAGEPVRVEGPAEVAAVEDTTTTTTPDAVPATPDVTDPAPTPDPGTADVPAGTADVASVEASTTSTTRAPSVTTPAAAPLPTPTTAAPTPTAPPASVAPRRPASTTTAAPPVTTAPPTTAAPTTTTAPVPAFPLVYATNAQRTGAMTLHGASLPRSSTIYVVALVSAWDVEFWYPGGGYHSEDNDPFDMLGTKGDGTATAYTLPSTPGTYTIQAQSTTAGTVKSVTSTFTVT